MQKYNLWLNSRLLYKVVKTHTVEFIVQTRVRARLIVHFKLHLPILELCSLK